MTIVTTYTCDKCGVVQTNPDEMWDIGVSLQPSSKRLGGKFIGPRTQKSLWCRQCVVSMGEKAPSPAPTLEDMVWEIVAEEMEAGG